MVITPGTITVFAAIVLSAPWLAHLLVESENWTHHRGSPVAWILWHIKSFLMAMRFALEPVGSAKRAWEWIFMYFLLIAIFGFGTLYTIVAAGLDNPPVNPTKVGIATLAGIALLCLWATTRLYKQIHPLRPSLQEMLARWIGTSRFQLDALGNASNDTEAAQALRNAQTWADIIRDQFLAYRRRDLWLLFLDCAPDASTQSEAMFTCIRVDTRNQWAEVAAQRQWLMKTYESLSNASLKQ